jgi:hypothetical protein
LLVLDADAMLAAERVSRRVTRFASAARHSGCRVAAVARRFASGPGGDEGAERAAALGLDAFVPMHDVNDTLRGLAAEMDVPTSRIVAVGDARESARLLASAGTAIAVDVRAAQQSAADGPGATGFLDSVLYLLRRI